MNILSVIKRVGGTIATIGASIYHFKPNDLGDHVCKVESPEHAARFLAIKDAYRPYDVESVAAAEKIGALIEAAGQKNEPPAPEDEDDVLTGDKGESDETFHEPPGFTSTYKIREDEYSLAEVIRAAAEAEGIDIATWNDLSDGAQAEIIETELDAIEKGESVAKPIQPAEPAAPVQNDEEAYEAAVAQYKAKYGRKPHANMTTASILKKLAEG